MTVRVRNNPPPLDHSCFESAFLLDWAYEFQDRSPTLTNTQIAQLLETTGVRTTAGPVISGLTIAWKQYCELGWAAWARLGNPVYADVVLSPTGRRADLVAGSTLIDVKVTRHTEESHAKMWLDQVLFYLFRDVDDRYKLDRLGVYLGWTGQLLTVTVDEVLAHLVDDRAASHELRADFYAVIKDDEEEQKRWRDAARRP
ncbi:hypothetical protein [Fodinicola feengrottensis]|uniref:hypothetical protein n=1 Tax=Fodinicola feengrottensis TaxID=435914 RepID=UPI0013D5D67E|nr:hypothetical protein [Fodinicola feengrottensis]